MGLPEHVQTGVADLAGANVVVGSTNPVPGMKEVDTVVVAGGIPFADGYADYFTLLNERDGGIGGVPIRLVECETGYNTKVSVECYENLKNEGESGSLIINPHSTVATVRPG